MVAKHFFFVCRRTNGKRLHSSRQDKCPGHGRFSKTQDQTLIATDQLMRLLILDIVILYDDG